MRKNLFASVALAVLAAVSCTKDEQPAAIRYFLEASLPESAQTKTTLGAKTGETYPVVWSEGDVICVNGVRSNPLPAEAAGGSSARFSFPGGVKAPFRITYGEGIPSFQEYAEGNIRSGYAVMAAESAESTFTMKHLSSIVSFTLSGGERVAGLSLRSLDGTLLSRESASVLMTVPAGGLDISEPKTFRFVVNPGTLEKGLVLEVYTTAGNSMVVTAFVGKRLAAGRLYEFPPMTFSANADSVVAISTYSELQTFATRVGAGEKALVARLTRDIDVSAGWTPLEGFTGEFDGAGYKITGLRRAFTQSLTGCIRNLVLEADITISGSADISGQDSDYWAGIFANRIYTGGLIDNCVAKGSITYREWGKMASVGGIAGYASRGTVRGCVNEAAVSVTGDGSNTVYAGGIIGYTYAGTEAVSLKGCRNEGSVSADGRLRSLNIGGIVGNMGTVHTSHIEGCVNNGDIRVAADATLGGSIHMGGIAGNSLNTISGCENHGNLRQSASSAYVQQVGGIAGSVVTERVSDCLNAGNMLLDGASATQAVRCGGLIGFSSGDAGVSGISVSRSAFSGTITVDIAAHATVYAKPFTGLYSIASYSESECSNTGKIEMK